MQRYLGASNFKEHIRSTLSACGSFVIAGSEDGYAYVWNTETGQSCPTGLNWYTKYYTPYSQMADTRGKDWHYALKRGVLG